MEEDELGTQRAIRHRMYVACSRCEQMIPIEAATIVPGDALEDHSEYTYLCQDCQQALADGDIELPTAQP